ncbi:hypothetical protein HYN69_01335 [Gemmobacter aquarius]|uniref:HTH LytTR-type domain-containing protein n=1 Tax=Paragemmobacter aquarius TaxID=2169400 RepID=A0A2S0UHM3_9RHOB|nr:LytTR family DNA-binding domain-containing protein [Gemmobacter aquarius]AWB47327.1 hypothetical protein HYN69_01335 [Gemmobacter aquarius]
MRRASKNPTGEGLHLRLVNGETLRMRRFESARAMLHRYLIALYVLMWMGLTLLDPSGQSTTTPLGIRLTQYGAGVLVVALGLIGFYTLADAIFGGKGRAVVISHWYVVLTVSALGLAASEATVFYLTGVERISAKIFAVLTVFYFVVIEIALQLVIWLLLPRILQELRKDPAISEPAAQSHARLQAGGHDIPPETILHIEAQGNYVGIVTDTHSYDVPGPFSALLVQLPQGLGLRVHRSHWVARRAVLAHRRKGRELVLDLTFGGEAKVALPRQAEVIDWLVKTAPKAAPDRPIPASDAMKA